MKLLNTALVEAILKCLDISPVPLSTYELIRQVELLGVQGDVASALGGMSSSNNPQIRRLRSVIKGHVPKQKVLDHPDYVEEQGLWGLINKHYSGID